MDTVESCLDTNIRVWYCVAMENMRIVRFEAENVKKLKAVEIVPTDDIVEISGKNESGKSSILDAIFMALGGKDALKSVTNPLRNGEKAGFVSIDLGDLTVRRTFTEGGGGTVTVTNADGAKFSSPQTTLNNLRAKFVDPQGFIDLKPADQKEALLHVVDLKIDLKEHADERTRLYAERTDVGRQGRDLGDPGRIDTSLPTTEQSASELLSRIRDAQTLIDDRRRAEEKVDRLKLELEAVLKRAEQLRNDISATENLLTQTESVPNLSGLTAQLSTIEATNATIRENNSRIAKQAQIQECVEKYENLTEQLRVHDQLKVDALAAANLPVDGLSIEDDGLTLNGVPFQDCSTAQKMLASLRIAASGSPKLRVIIIQRGESLDDDNFDVVREFAREHGYQIWIETVGDGHGSAVIMEDGEIA